MWVQPYSPPGMLTNFSRYHRPALEAPMSRGHGHPSSPCESRHATLSMRDPEGVVLHSFTSSTKSASSKTFPTPILPSHVSGGVLGCRRTASAPFCSLQVRAISNAQRRCQVSVEIRGYRPKDFSTLPTSLLH